MAQPQPVSAADLRQAMRDPSYWRAGHPERVAYGRWVSQAWQQLHPADGPAPPGGVVWVRPYDRTRFGRPEEVDGHYRGTGASRASAPGRPTPALPGAPAAGPVGAAPPAASHVARDGTGRVIGRAGRWPGGRQETQLVLRDGRVVTQEWQAVPELVTPVFWSPAVTMGMRWLLPPAIALYGSMLERWLGQPADQAAERPVLLYYRGLDGTEAGAQVTVGSLREEEVRQFCPKTTEFEVMLQEVVDGTPRGSMTAAQWGTAVHLEMKRRIIARYIGRRENVAAELSLSGGDEGHYGTKGSTRLDIYHQVEGTDVVCVYDVKTGSSGLSQQQASRLFNEALRHRGPMMRPPTRVIVIEPRPAQP